MMEKIININIFFKIYLALLQEKTKKGVIKMTKKEIENVASDEIQRQITDGILIKNYDEGVIEFTEKQLEQTLEEFAENGWDSEEQKIIKECFESYEFEEEEPEFFEFKTEGGGVDWYESGYTINTHFEMKKVGGK